MSFRLGGDRLDPDAITRALGMTPAFAAATGQEVNLSSGRATRQRLGVWLIDTDGAVESTSAERHLLWLLERIEPVADSLRVIRSAHDLTAEFFCGWFSATGHGGPEVSAKTLARIAALDAALSFDFYDSRPRAGLIGPGPDLA